MLIVLSPAKTLDYDTPPVTDTHSRPDFLDDSAQLIEELRTLSADEIGELMGVSDKLAELNFGRFRDWHTPFTPGNAKQAALAFKGDVYTGLDAEAFSEKDFEFAQAHLRILSGLYGLLRPLDLMQPYRLEMGTRFANSRGKNLYAFWGETLTDALNRQLEAIGGDSLVNLASNEYFKAVKPRRLNAPVVTPVFKDWKGGKYKVVSFYAKKARGMMAAWAIRERATRAEALKAFDGAGYGYDASLSTDSEWVFTRRES